MNTTTVEVTHNESGERREFATVAEAQEWADQVRRTLGVWGGEPTFTAVKVTREEVRM